MKKEKLNTNLKIAILVTVVLVFIAQTLAAYSVSNLKEEPKVLIKNIINLSYVENTGGPFGIGKDDTEIFILISLIIIAIIIRFMISQKDRMDRATVISLSMILAGGFSNLIDRCFRRAVVDYFDVSPIIKLPVFNLSDILIICGWIVFVISIIIYWINGTKKVNEAKMMYEKDERIKPNESDRT